MKKILLNLGMLFIAGIANSQTLTVTTTTLTASCNADGSASASASGGTAPYTYVWSIYQISSGYTVVGSGATITGPGGYYQVVATDANNVQGTASYVYVPSVLDVYVSNIVSPNCPQNDGSVTYTVNGGTGPYDYYWSNGSVYTGQSASTSTENNLGPGQYTLIVYDSNGCTNSNPNDSAAYLNATSNFTVSMNTSPSNCNDGTATATVIGGTGPFTYYWNTSPPQTTATATGLDGNTWTFVTVTSSEGCEATGYANIAYGQGALQSTATINSAVCPNNNGSINITVSNGTAPYTYIWSNGATTEDISGLASGAYTLTITDNAGCQLTEEKYVWPTSPLSVNVTSTSTGCNNNTGSASASVSGGTAPYSYLWYNNGNTQTINNLGQGYYGVTVTDANGCQGTGYNYVNIPYACYSDVSGYVYNDEDGNCVQNGNELGMPYQIVSLGNNTYTSTNYDGSFHTISLSNETYTISHTATTGWDLNCPASAYTVNVSAGQYVSGNDFYDQPQTISNDLRLYIYGGLAVPGNNYVKYYSVHNFGTITANGTVEFIHDANEMFMGGGNVLSYDAPNRKITIDASGIAAFGNAFGTLNFSLPSSVSIGTELTNTGVVNPVSGDANPDNNYDTVMVTVVGSYDPNEKEVSPKGFGAAGLIPASNDFMDYTVHFQNTGTYYANTVVVVDTLDADLDITTLEVTGKSHDLTWNVSGPGIIKFTFNNIYLPWETYDEPNSHGFVSYRIKQKANLAGGTEIKNTAYIYFDYNAPVVTNTTLNTIEITGISENKFTNGVTISPNPASNYLTISNKNKEICSNVRIIDISGRTVANIAPNGNIVNLPELANGIYIINATYPSGVYTEKLVISK